MTSTAIAALSRIREYLPQAWRHSHQNFIDHGQRFFMDKRTAIPACLSTDMCRHTTLFLLDLLTAAGDDRWSVAGGFCHYANASASVAESGSGGQHWWLENGDWILDLTADQFGWEPVVLTPVTDPRYQRKPELSKKRYVSRLRSTVDQWKGVPTSIWMAHAPAVRNMKETFPALQAAFIIDWAQARV